MDFVQRLRHIQRKNNSILCIGLDTDAMKVPEFLYAYGDPQYEFNRRIIDATKDIVCAYKLNVAFYGIELVYLFGLAASLAGTSAGANVNPNLIIARINNVQR